MKVAVSSAAAAAAAAATRARGMPLPAPKQSFVTVWRSPCPARARATPPLTHGSSSFSPVLGVLQLLATVIFDPRMANNATFGSMISQRQCCRKGRQNRAQTHWCRSGYISVFLIRTSRKAEMQPARQARVLAGFCRLTFWQRWP